jgi:hypothetical protein
VCRLIDVRQAKCIKLVIEVRYRDVLVCRERAGGFTISHLLKLYLDRKRPPESLLSRATPGEP